MELRNSFWTFENILPKTFCDEIVQYGKEQNLGRGVVFLEQKNIHKKGKAKEKISKEASKIRESNVCFLNLKWVYKNLTPIMQTANRNAGWNFEIQNSEHVQFTEYNTNQHYSFHSDSSAEPFVGGEHDGMIRKISMSVNLTDPLEYEGGEFLFKVPDGSGSYHELKPTNFGSKGSIVVFPSFVIHTVKPVTKGTRHSLVMWSCGYPFK